MALNQKIRLQIISALDNAGIKATADQLDKLQSKVLEANATTQGLGKQFSSAFNPLEAVMSVATGNINGMAKAAVQLGLAIKGVTVSVGTMTGIFGGIMLAVAAVKKLTEVFKNQKTEIEAATEAAQKNAKAIQDAQKATRDSIRAAFGQVDEAAKRRDAELEAIEKEIAAEKRLEMETAKRNGDLETAARLQAEITQAAKDEAIRRKENAIGDIDAKIAAVEKKVAGAEAYDKRAAEQERRRLNGLIARKELEIKERMKVEKTATPGVIIARPVGDLKAEIEDLQKAKEKLVSDSSKKNIAHEEIEKLKADRTNLERDLNAFKKIQIAEAIKVETEEIKKQNDERMKEEEALHRQRMENLKAEAAAAKSELDSAKARFDREFSLYKDQDALVKQIEAEKKDDEARKQLAKDAARYGGKWRIDELSRLYAANDEEGVRKTLSDWRKNSRFTPQVEAMVRAAAAGENVKTMEDRVDEIAKNTKGLAEKIDELLSMKG